MQHIKEKTIIILGIWLFVLPFTGFPQSWKIYLTAITGIVIIYLGALFFKNARVRTANDHTETKTETFTETV